VKHDNVPVPSADDPHLAGPADAQLSVWPPAWWWWEIGWLGLTPIPYYRAHDQDLDERA
jgi:hypothetical protein